MHKIILVLILMTLLSGCVLPNDTGFMETVKELDTPKKIAQYMYFNFEYEYQKYGVKTPLELFTLKKGDCNDFSNFAAFVGNYHGYSVYQVRLIKEGINHWITVFNIDDYFVFINNRCYNIDKYKSINDIIDFFSVFYKDYIGYEIYNHEKVKVN